MLAQREKEQVSRLLAFGEQIGGVGVIPVKPFRVQGFHLGGGHATEFFLGYVHCHPWKDGGVWAVPEASALICEELGSHEHFSASGICWFTCFQLHPGGNRATHCTLVATGPLSAPWWQQGRSLRPHHPSLMRQMEVSGEWPFCPSSSSSLSLSLLALSQGPCLRQLPALAFFLVVGV